ncbi:target of Myb1 membrane trafficking protein isoform X4 [Lepisosteus oculatus]|uniref:target of Myb1 membrane trafficking protein isoform X4 n=1 Tax=Lepisosteus oculatus TaxID=7918 RepID=UPI0035F525BA
MDFLLGSPYATPVGQRIENATSATLQSEDWGLNMEICDIINETEEGPKDAIRALKKRIVGNKNFREVMLALTVLESCVKNCGHRFHVLVASRDFVEGVLVRTILPKNNPPQIVHDKVLSLIQSWADAFRSSPSLTGVVSVYEDLRRKGLEFPMTDLDALSPIHTPQRSVPDTDPSHASPQDSTAPPAVPAQSPARTGGPFDPSSEQRAKLSADLEVVRGNVAVMSDMLSGVNPGRVEPSDLELLQELNRTCRVMQTRVLELIPQVGAEGLIEELLILNDTLNGAFTRYDRFERLHSRQAGSTQDQVSINTSDTALIDLTTTPVIQSTVPEPVNQSAVSSLSNQMANLSTASVSTVSPASGGDDDFDMFAQTRGSSLAEQRKSVRYEDPGAMEGLAGALDTRLQNTGAEPRPEPAPLSSSPHSDWMLAKGMIPVTQTCVMDDIEQWLSADLRDGGAGEAEGVTSEEFDRFLEERAKAADRLPPLEPPSGTPRTPSGTPRPSSQPAQKQDSVHEQLFAL